LSGHKTNNTDLELGLDLGSSKMLLELGLTKGFIHFCGRVEEEQFIGDLRGIGSFVAELNLWKKQERKEVNFYPTPPKKKNKKKNNNQVKDSLLCLKVPVISILLNNKERLRGRKSGKGPIFKIGKRAHSGSFLRKTGTA